MQLLGFLILGFLSSVNGAEFDRPIVDPVQDLADTDNDLIHRIKSGNLRNLETVLKDQRVDNVILPAIDGTRRDEIEDNSNEIENGLMDSSIQGVDSNTADASEKSDINPGVPLFQDSDDMEEDGLKCSLTQTMAWEECDKKIVCDTTCQSETDCTFKYCNRLGLCECTPAFCKTDRMCNFFRINCQGNFTCRNGNCYCG